MTDLAMIRERYLRDPLGIRLGGVAANLARIASFSRSAANRDVVESVVEETKQFIEWTAGESDADAGAELVRLQVELARWQLGWRRTWDDPAERQRIAEASRAWSQRVLEMSGLLDDPVTR